jgi:hypothetical protein
MLAPTGTEWAVNDEPAQGAPPVGPGLARREPRLGFGDRCCYGAGEAVGGGFLGSLLAMSWQRTQVASSRNAWSIGSRPTSGDEWQLRQVRRFVSGWGFCGGGEATGL